MKALSLKQPWAWAILSLGKDIENRSWVTAFRGRFLIHASKNFDVDGYDFVLRMAAEKRVVVPRATEFERGGIVGSAVVRDCVQASASPWFFGPHGFVLQGVQSLPFIPCRGQVGFFDVPAPADLERVPA
ncbi:ASCH domain-containing protein [Pseudorhodoplanes sinuspersici]|uniref:Uncharacterized protein n=1 Tax=Pseudorhodoplanes sinuspersici TaxID=1235591 RepID=A0A1W6ZXN5_9HYPH|nr:ASCH domain-containing protein [Pseudorhodoplanes sinuspersici]ARQ01901.1 hypothetical protein CAK95_24480 [Pseudorhodoplanes sinuspersici]RKE73667.1 ASCH domain-containing protein [Pseudorhodoplanes sinuspersici]